MQSFVHFDCNNQVLVCCSFTYVFLPFLPINNVFIIVDFPCSCNDISLASFLRFYKFTEGNKFSNVLDILKSNLLYINQGLNILSQSSSAKSLSYLHALSHTQNIITRGIIIMFLTNADSLLNIGVVSLIIYICISLLVAILAGYLFNYTLIKEIKKLTTKVDELSYPLSQIANNTSSQISKQSHSENTQVKNTINYGTESNLNNPNNN